jgi:hypothetical protein
MYIVYNQPKPRSQRKEKGEEKSCKLCNGSRNTHVNRYVHNGNHKPAFFSHISKKSQRPRNAPPQMNVYGREKCQKEKKKKQRKKTSKITHKLEPLFRRPDTGVNPKKKVKENPQPPCR